MVLFLQLNNSSIKKYSIYSTVFSIGKTPIFATAGLARPAPAELPQDRKIARVGGCSGAM